MQHRQYLVGLGLGEIALKPPVMNTFSDFAFRLSHIQYPPMPACAFAATAATASRNGIGLAGGVPPASILHAERGDQARDLLLLRLDDVEQFRRRGLILFHPRVRIHRLEIEVPGFDLGARDGPTAVAVCSGG